MCAFAPDAAASNRASAHDATPGRASCKEAKAPRARRSRAVRCSMGTMVPFPPGKVQLLGMRILAGIAGAVLVAIVLWDAFETIVLPRRVTRRVRLTRFFYRATWRPFAASARLVHAGGRREAYLGFYGPLSLLLLLVLVGRGLGPGLRAAAVRGQLRCLAHARNRPPHHRRYLSGTTFFTLGLGDVAPQGTFARVLTVVESGLGFGFLAIVIGYFPVLYQAFSRREVSISLLDARAGSPPSAAELLRRHGGPGGAAALERLLTEWETLGGGAARDAPLVSAARLFPLPAHQRVLARRPHDGSRYQRAGDGRYRRGARGRRGSPSRWRGNAVVDLTQVFNTPPLAEPVDRCRPPRSPGSGLRLAVVELPGVAAGVVDGKLAEVRRGYEPYVAALSRYLLLPLPEWDYETQHRDNWQSTGWGRRTAPPPAEHF